MQAICATARATGTVGPSSVITVGDLTLDDPDLVVPHPRMWERRFVLAPLADLAPELVPPERLAAAAGDVRRTAVDLTA